LARKASGVKQPIVRKIVEISVEILPTTKEFLKLNTSSSSSSSAFALAWRNYSPRSILLLLQGSMSIFVCHYG
jgi:hypothetical protein